MRVFYVIDGLISGIGSIFGAGIQAAADKKMNEQNIAFQREINEQNQKNWEKQFDFNRTQWETGLQREDTAHQREVEDLQLAGLNTQLAGNMSGAGAGAVVGSSSLPDLKAPQLQRTNFGNSVSSAVQDAIGTILKEEGIQVERKSVENGKIVADAGKENAEANKLTSEANYLKALTDAKRAGVDIERGMQEINESKSRERLNSSQYELNEARTELSNALTSNAVTNGKYLDAINSLSIQESQVRIAEIKQRTEISDQQERLLQLDYQYKLLENELKQFEVGTKEYRLVQDAINDNVDNMVNVLRAYNSSKRQPYVKEVSELVENFDEKERRTGYTTRTRKERGR